MSQAELDSILLTVENPVRRMLIKRLSEEPSYQLQLSKDLGLSQQLVAKHLDSMEGAGLITSTLEASPKGPKRREYLLQRSVSVTIDFAPNLFRTRVFSFGAIPGISEDLENDTLVSKINEITRYPDEASKLGPLAEIIRDVDKRLKAMEEERAILIYLRSLAIVEAVKASSSLHTTDRKKMFHYLLREQGDSVNQISESLGLKEQMVDSMLDEIIRDLSSIP